MSLLSFFAPPSSAQTAELESDTQLSREGYFVLSWELEEASTQNELVLQQALSEEFIQPQEYPIPAQGSLTLSGLPNATYHFRAGRPGHWSDTITVTVEHHGLGRALLFFGLGLVLFATLTTVILKGNRRHDVERASHHE